MYRIGIDVGGTFTDFTLLHEGTGGIGFHKVPSTPRDPAAAIREGMAEILRLNHIPANKVSHVGHGTTVATNIVIERRGSLTGLLTTRGFRDVLEIGRQTRPNLYDYRVQRPTPLVPRELRLEIDERCMADGTILKELDEDEVRHAAETLREAGVASVAICFLHAYRNPDHERRAAEIVRDVMPEAYVSCSCEVLPEFREYERLSTTILNAYVGPRMETYLRRFVSDVGDLGVEASPYIVHSNGGLMSPATASLYPVRSCLSGPAAGVIGASLVSVAAGFANIITFDAGGTSTDVSLVWQGRPRFTSARSVADYPVKTLMVDIHVIGAGGGSIAWLDGGGALKVGPHSAGAEPGPVAYGNGGSEPTITDAHVTLGHLDPVSLLDGKVKVDAKAARKAIADGVAEPLGLGIEEAAHGITKIANANIARAIRSISVERGFSLSQFALVAFGGAGPLHAAQVARDLGVPTVLIPREPGTMCARGILLSDISLDFVRSDFIAVSEATWPRVKTLFDDMGEQAQEWLSNEGVLPELRSHRCVIEARYQGQNHEIAVIIPSADLDLETFTRMFADAHRAEYRYDIEDRQIELVACRLQAIGTVPKAPLAAQERTGNIEESRKGWREVHFEDVDSWTSVPVYRRETLPSGQRIEGPAIIEEMSSTTVLLPKQSATIDLQGNIIINVFAGAVQ